MTEKQTFRYFKAFLFFSLAFPLIIFGQGETCSTASQITQSGFITADGPSSGNGCFNCSPGTPGGIPAENADWYYFEVPSNGILSISSCNGGADTRLWVYEGTCGSLNLLDSNDDFCDFAPQEPYAAAVNDLQVNAGQTIFLEWDDAWDLSGFVFEFTFEAIEENLAIDGWVLPFTGLPLQQLSGNLIELPVNVTNQGQNLAQNVILRNEIFEEGSNIPIETFDTAPFDLNPSETRGFLLGNLNGLQQGTFYVKQSIVYSGQDDKPEDDVSETQTFRITTNEFSLDDGDFTGGIGIAGPGKFYLGQYFDFYSKDTLLSVLFNIIGGNLNDSIQAQIYTYNNLTGRPQDLVASSNYYRLQNGDPEWLEIPLEMPFEVEAGEKYLIALVHHATGRELNLGVSPNIFKPSNAWIAINDPNWIAIESLASPGTNDYNVALGIRPRTNLSDVNVLFSVDMQGQNISNEGVFVQIIDETGASREEMLSLTSGSLYEGSFAFSILGNFSYRFFNGNPSNAGVAEIVPAACGTMENGTLYRTFSTQTSDIQFQKVCFGSCTICPPDPCSDPNFFICDDVEAYNLGDVTPQAPHWDIWDPGSEGAVVTNQFAASGIQSLQIKGGSSTGGPQDVVLRLDSPEPSSYVLDFKLFIPENKSAYFGILHKLIDYTFGVDVYFDPLEEGVIYQGTELLGDFTYTYDQWMEISVVVDQINDFNKIILDGNEIYSGKFSTTTDLNGSLIDDDLSLAGINFYPFDTQYEFYIDDVYFYKSTELPGNLCSGSIDLNGLLGKAFNVPQISSGYSNAGFTTESPDPTDGVNCFSDAGNPLHQTIWFTVIGDGEQYDISALTNPNGPCAINNSFPNGDAQFAIYSGTCDQLTPVECAEDRSMNDRSPGTILTLEDGVEYFIMVDGTDIYSSLPEGEFCMQFIRLEPTATVDFIVDMTELIKDGGSISPDGIFINGSATGNQAVQLNDLGGNFFGTSLELAQNTNYDFRYFNGMTNGEDLSNLNACGAFDASNNIIGRRLEVPDFDIILDTVCYAACVACDTTSNVMDLSLANGWSVYPNPAKDVVYIKNHSGTSSLTNYQYELVDPIGRKVRTGNVSGHTFQIELSNLPSGLYQLLLNEGSRILRTKIIVKNAP
ncbi:MAG: T9SS type A sorting domain-containing protein [Saprospiraceae bacterium]